MHALTCVLCFSAGVGRTGTFITLHAQMKRLKAEDNYDIFGFVEAMRYRRCFMVQTEVQATQTVL